MGLDIYFHKTKLAFNGDKNNNDDLSAFTKEVDELAKKRIGKKLRTAIKPLRKLWNDAHYTDKETGETKVNEYRMEDYRNAYFDLVVKVLKPTIAKNYDFKLNPYTKKVLDFPDLETAIEHEIDMSYEEYDAYFRKVNFIFAYFKNKGKMLDQWFAFVTKEDVDDLIYCCERVLKDHSNAYGLLPTQSGFFFGSTDYDDWYFNDVKDCLRQMKKYRKLLKDGVTGYVIFSW